MKNAIITLSVLLAISVIGNIIFAVSELKYRATKKDIKDSVSKVEDSILSIDDIVKTNNLNMEQTYQETINSVSNMFKNDEMFEELEPLSFDFDDSCLEEIRITQEKVILEVGSNRFQTTMPDNVEELQALVRKMQVSHNTLNTLLNKERENRIYVTKTVTNEIIKIQTNIQVVYEKVDNMQKPKTWSFAAGIGGTWNGRINGIDCWGVSLHGLVFFKSKIYVGLTLGLESQLSIQPSVGGMIGWKFN